MKSLLPFLFCTAGLLANPSNNHFWESRRINGGYTVQILDQNKWIDAGRVRFSVRYKTKEIALPEGPVGDVRIRLVPENGNTAHVDLLDLDGHRPVTVTGLTRPDLALLASSDYDVAAIRGPVEAVFKNASEQPMLRLRARIEPERLYGLPIPVPGENLGREPDEWTDFFSYTMGSNPGRLRIDGELEDEELKQPFFRMFTRTCTGHPSGDIFGWVRDDGEKLYVALDFTPDNTFDGDADYASIHVRNGRVIRTFRASLPEQTWGSPGFTYSSRVPYHHKTYEFAIPLSELDHRETLDLAFELYGTAAVTFPAPYALIENLGVSVSTPTPVTAPFEYPSFWPTGVVDIHPETASAVLLAPGGPALFDFNTGPGMAVLTWDADENLPGSDPLPFPYFVVTPGPVSYNLVGIESINIQVQGVTGNCPAKLTLYGPAGSSSISNFPLSTGLMKIPISTMANAILSSVNAIQVAITGGTGASCLFQYVINGEEVTLAVSMTSLYAIPAPSSIELHWQTASEVDNAGFFVERMALDIEETFSRISGLIQGRGNTSEVTDYRFTDRNLKPDQAYLYRLISLETDGREEEVERILARTSEEGTSIQNRPDAVTLEANYPNPFNPETTIRFNLPVSMHARLEVFSAGGSLIRTLVDGVMPAGERMLVWNGKNTGGIDVGSGTYICRLTAGNRVLTRRMQLVR